MGIRIPDHAIPRVIVQELGHPIITTSIHHEDEVLDYITEAYLIEERFGKLVDIIIDGGTGGIEPSTIVDCTGDEPVVLREGKGDPDII